MNLNFDEPKSLLYIFIGLIILDLIVMSLM